MEISYLVMDNERGVKLKTLKASLGRRCVRLGAMKRLMGCDSNAIMTGWDEMIALANMSLPEGR